MLRGVECYWVDVPATNFASGGLASEIRVPTPLGDDGRQEQRTRS